jgi:hypothetical protein
VSLFTTIIANSLPFFTWPERLLLGIKDIALLANLVAQASELFHQEFKLFIIIG